MLKFEEYVARRKKEDRLNEFDVGARSENMRTCVNYVFEYFNNYLDISELENKTVLQNEKIERFHKQLREYDTEIQDWLVGIFSEYGIVLHRVIINILKRNELFYLFNTNREYRQLSYDCYAKLSKKYAFLKDQTEMLFLFIKDYHRILSQETWRSEIQFISETSTVGLKIPWLNIK